MRAQHYSVTISVRPSSCLWLAHHNTPMVYPGLWHSCIFLLAVPCLWHTCQCGFFSYLPPVWHTIGIPGPWQHRPTRVTHARSRALVRVSKCARGMQDCSGRLSRFDDLTLNDKDMLKKHTLEKLLSFLHTHKKYARILLNICTHERFGSEIYAQNFTRTSLTHSQHEQHKTCSTPCIYMHIYLHALVHGQLRLC